MGAPQSHPPRRGTCAPPAACRWTRRRSGSCARPAARCPSTGGSASARRSSRSPATPRCAPRSRSSRSAAWAWTPRSCSRTSRRRSPASASPSTSWRAAGPSSSTRSGRWPTWRRCARSSPRPPSRPLLEAIRLIRAESPVPLIGFAGAPFTLACYLVEGGPSRDFLRHQAADARGARDLGRAAGPPGGRDDRVPLRAGGRRRPGRPGVRLLGRRALAAGLRAPPVAVDAPPVRGDRAARRADDALRRGDRRASSTSRRPPAATSSASTGGSRCPRAGGSSATGPSRGTWTRCCSWGPGRASRRRPAGSWPRTTGDPATSSTWGTASCPGTDPDHLKRLVDLVHDHGASR